MKMRTLILVAALTLVAGLLSAQSTTPAQPATPAPQHQMHGGMQHGSAMPMDCAAMMKKHEQMQAEMKAADEKLQKLVTAMNSATGAKKTDATAAVVAELVAQHQAMHQHMEQMMPEMMQHMMEHMQSGMAAGMKSGMNCPMMKESSGVEQPHQH